MSRTIHADTITALASDSFNLATLVRFDFDSPIYLTDHSRDLTVSSTTYTSSAHLQAIAGVTESSQLKVNNVTIRLSGVEQSYVSIVLGQDYMGARARIWRAVIDESDDVVGSEILVFDGRIVGYALSDTRNSSNVEIELASHWKDFDLVKGRRTNHNSQQIYFSGDLGFEFAAESAKDIKWGRA
tara:strand:+ start:137 stop:691 length:555 start_codon:yes stop_codon:yes gene_type:complete